MPILTDAQVLDALKTLRQWGYEGGELSRRFRFKDFIAAFGFVAQAAALQQSLGHYGTVTQEGPIVLIDLRSENSGVTERDIELARGLSDRATNAL